MIRTQVYLPEELYQNIHLLAKKEKKVKAQVIRELLKNGLTLKDRRQKTIGRALLELAKISAKGPSDLSTNHDKYLYKDE